MQFGGLYCNELQLLYFEKSGASPHRRGEREREESAVTDARIFAIGMEMPHFDELRTFL